MRLLILVFSLFTLSLCSTEDSLSISHKKLIDEYLKKETSSEFLKKSYWLDKHIYNKEVIPGFDSFKIIEDFSFKLAYNTKDSVSYIVNYKVIGLVLQNSEGGYIKFIKEDDKEQIILKKIEGNWMIVHPLTVYHILPNFLEKYLNKNEIDKLKDYLSSENK